jgi:hypothetical protein
METNKIKKVLTNYIIEEEYKNRDGKLCIVEIKLSINNLAGNYSIYNYHNDSFKFVTNSKEKNMWLAVTNCINKAIKFAEEELKLGNSDINF